MVSKKAAVVGDAASSAPVGTLELGRSCPPLLFEQVVPTALHLEPSEVTLFKALDPKVQDRWRIQTEVKQALLGYAILDFIEYKHRLVFGTWNPRALQPRQVKRLVESFHVEGLDRFDLKGVIPIVISQNLIDPASVVQDPTDPLKLTELKLLQSNSQEVEFKCAGGRHRVASLEVYLEEIQTGMDKLIAERDAIMNLAGDELTEAEVRKFNNVLPEEMKRLGGILKYGGQWMVAVYDEGSVFDPVSPSCSVYSCPQTLFSRKG